MHLCLATYECSVDAYEWVVRGQQAGWAGGQVRLHLAKAIFQGAGFPEMLAGQ